MSRNRKANDIDALVRGELWDPHSLLGIHPIKDGTKIVRAWKPDAQTVQVRVKGEVVAKLEQVHPAGVFEGAVDDGIEDYELEVGYADGNTFTMRDPYSFPPTLGEIDLHLVGEGRHYDLHEKLGAHRRKVNGVDGFSFAVWAPNARSVRLVGTFNSWDGRLHPMRGMGSSGIWEIFVPDLPAGSLYKFEVITAQGDLVLKTDPYGFATEVPPSHACIAYDSKYEWSDDEWIEKRKAGVAHQAPMSVYEMHMGSWRRGGEGEFLGYRDLAPLLADYLREMGFTHVELLPVAEHPFGGSWGYQVSNYFAPTARFGSPDDFRYFVDTLHQAGIGVIVDWVPAHFPKDEWALASFDGTALYEHADPRKGEHPDWGTLVFNYARNEVRNFLISNALFWLEDFHIDGLRVDAVASMLYLDYSREEGEWVPNQYGGRENLDAISFLQELNSVVYEQNPGTLMIAEESTAWGGVSKPVHLGGLGFGFKWNMGWMHDTLSYWAKDPIYRRFHHNQVTFSMVYAFSENFVLPLSHDEVVHGKGSLVGKMPGDRWQRFANLRALYAFMWAHPGKMLLFMGGEIGQEREWNHDASLDWHLLDDASHSGLQKLVADLNKTYKGLPALWELDHAPEGFSWIDANDADQNVFSFFRTAEDGERHLACVLNMSPVPRYRYRIGLPKSGEWQEVVNTDADTYGGGGVGNLGTVWAAEDPWHGLDYSALVTIPPLGAIWLASS